MFRGDSDLLLHRRLIADHARASILAARLEPALVTHLRPARTLKE